MERSQVGQRIAGMGRDNPLTTIYALEKQEQAKATYLPLILTCSNFFSPLTDRTWLPGQ